MAESDQHEIDVYAAVEERIADFSSPVARAFHINKVVAEIDEGDSISLWQTPEQKLRRNDIDDIGGQLLKSIVANWFSIHPSMYRGSSVPSVDKITNGLIGKSQGAFVNPYLSRLAVPDETIEEYIRNNANADPNSFRQYELSIEVCRGRDRTVYSALGLLSFKNEKMVGGRRSPRVDARIVPASGGSALQAEVQASIDRANILSEQAMRNPSSGGLPGTGKRKQR